MPRFDELTSVRRLDGDRFAATAPVSSTADRVFGGFIMATALRAAAATVSREVPPTAMRCSLPRAASTASPLELQVERLRDGRTFTLRQVLVRQEGKLVGVVHCSFVVPSEGPTWWTPPTVESPTLEECEPCISSLAASHGFEIRRAKVVPDNWSHPMWVHTPGAASGNYALQAAAVAAMSDFAAGNACAPSHMDLPRSSSVTLEHSVDFHVLNGVDDWLLLDAQPMAVASGRGFMSGALWTRNGSRIASIHQTNYWLTMPIWGDPE